MLISPGLVSVTFRQLTVQQVVDLCAQSGLTGIEWGGDVHVPHGDVSCARTTHRTTQEAGLSVAAYGSYYRTGHEDSGPFENVLATAGELGASCIRVWAGRQGTDTADEAYWEHVVTDTQRIAGLAQAAGIDIVLEFHRNTLTDTAASARLLLERVDHPAVFSYWQPPRGSLLDANLAAMDALAPWLYGLHLFTWHETTGERLALADRADNWRQYLRRADALGREMYALLEFVQDDDPASFLNDAHTLKGWLAKL